MVSSDSHPRKLAAPRQRIAVFVDGCFWHGCPEHGTLPKTNAAWWREKIESNRECDSRVSRQLELAGWTVIRIWEHEDLSGAADRVEKELDRYGPE